MLVIPRRKEKVNGYEQLSEYIKNHYFDAVFTLSSCGILDGEGPLIHKFDELLKNRQLRLRTKKAESLRQDITGTENQVTQYMNGLREKYKNIPDDKKDATQRMKDSIFRAYKALVTAEMSKITRPDEVESMMANIEYVDLPRFEAQRNVSRIILPLWGAIKNPKSR